MRYFLVILITLSYTVNGEKTDTDKEDTDYNEVGIDSTSSDESNFQTVILKRLDNLVGEINNLKVEVLTNRQESEALSENGEHIDAALTDLKSKWQIVHDAQFQLTMKQLTIDNEKDALANKIARIDSQVGGLSISMEKHETDIQKLQTRAQSLEDSKDKMGNRIKNLEEVSVEDHSYLKNVNVTLKNEVATSSNQTNAIVSIQNEIGDLNILTTKSIADIGTLQTNQLDLISQTNETNTSITSIETDIEAIETWTKKIGVQVADLENVTDSHASNIKSNQGNIAKMVQDAASVENRVLDIEDLNLAQETNIAELENKTNANADLNRYLEVAYGQIFYNTMANVEMIKEVKREIVNKLDSRVNTTQSENLSRFQSLEQLLYGIESQLNNTSDFAQELFQQFEQKNFTDMEYKARFDAFVTDEISQINVTLSNISTWLEQVNIQANKTETDLNLSTTETFEWRTAMESVLKSFNSTMKDLSKLVNTTNGDFDSEIQNIQNTLSSNDVRMGENRNMGLDLKTTLEDVIKGVKNDSDRMTAQLGDLKTTIESQATDFGSKIKSLQDSSATNVQQISFNAKQLMQLKDITGTTLLKNGSPKSTQPFDQRRKKSLSNAHCIFGGGEGCDNQVSCVPNPCQHGGRCLWGGETYKCECSQGWSGQRCEEDQDECQNTSRCMNGGTCINTPGSYDCECSGTGFEGDRCQDDKDECQDSPCLNGASCQNLIGNFTCSCKPHSRGLLCGECEDGWNGPGCANDVNECLNGPCKNNGICTNTPGGFKCKCPTTHDGVLCETKRSYCAKVFKEPNYKGDSRTLNDRDYTSQPGSDWNNKISSIKVRQGCSFKVYDYENYVDGNDWSPKTWYSDETSLGSPYENDISSWQCYC